MLGAQGVLYVETGRFTEARLLLERAIALGTELFGADHPESVTSLVGLAEVQLVTGDAAAAKRSSARALRITEKSFGQDHINVVGALNQLGRASFELGHYRDAAHHWNRALQLVGKIRSPDHPDALSITVQLVQVARLPRNFAEAERLLSSALRSSEAWGAKLLHAVALHQLALIHADQKRHDLAEPLLRRSLAITESALGSRATGHAICAVDLARSLIALRKIAEAEELVRKSIALLEQRGGAAHPWFITLLRDHVVLLRKLNRKDEAKQVESRVQALLTSGSVNRGNHTVDLLELDANR